MTSLFIPFLFLSLTCIITLHYCNGDLHFQVFGDWGMGNDQQKMVAMAMMTDAIKKNGIDFVLNVGDNFYKNKDSTGEKQGGITNITDPLWEKYFKNVYIDSLRKVTFYSVLGNHDYMGNITAQVKYHQLDPRWYMPDFSYNVTVRVDDQTAATLVFIDTSPIIEEYYKHPENPTMASNIAKQDYKKQLKWLEIVLAESSTDWKFVIGHHPIVSSTTVTKMTESYMNLVNDLLVKYKVAAYFCGHIHQMEHHTDSYIDYFISGAGATGKIYESDPASEFTLQWAGYDAGFISASLTRDWMHVNFLATDLSVQYSTSTSRPKSFVKI